MPKVGVEPTLPEENYALNVARLPIPPLRLVHFEYTRSAHPVKTGIAGFIRRAAFAIMRRAFCLSQAKCTAKES